MEHFYFHSLFSTILSNLPLSNLQVRVHNITLVSVDHSETLLKSLFPSPQNRHNWDPDSLSRWDGVEKVGDLAWRKLPAFFRLSPPAGWGTVGRGSRQTCLYFGANSASPFAVSASLHVRLSKAGSRMGCMSEFYVGTCRTSPLHCSLTLEMQLQIMSSFISHIHPRVYVGIPFLGGQVSYGVLTGRKIRDTFCRVQLRARKEEFLPCQQKACVLDNSLPFSVISFQYLFYLITQTQSRGRCHFPSYHDSNLCE